MRSGDDGPRRAVLGGLALAVLGAAGLAAGLEPFRTYFYAFVWWGWIFVASGWTHARAGRSLLFTRPRALGLLTLWSVPFWLVFECLNVVLDNWYYVGAMPTLPGRLFGMAVCFATVLPGVFVTREWLASFGWFAGARLRPRPLGPRLARDLALVGAVCTALPLAWPQYFFPLVWGATFFLGEAYLVHRRRRGLIATLASGDPRPALQLLAAGFVTGGLWEAWNFHAGAKWIYTVPYFEAFKLFEMPVLGFLGFPPFALECYSFACLLVALGLCPPFDDGFDAPDEALPSRLRVVLGAACGALVAVPMMLLTDAEVVRGTRPTVDELATLPPATRRQLEREGYADVRDLARALDAGAPPDAWEALDPGRRAAAADELALATLAGLGARGVAWLRAVDVTSVGELASLDWRRVVDLATGDTARARDLLRRHGPAPYDREVRVWVRAAVRARDARP